MSSVIYTVVFLTAAFLALDLIVDRRRRRSRRTLSNQQSS